MTAVQQGETTVSFPQCDEIISEETYLSVFGLITNSSDSFTNFDFRIYDFFLNICNDFVFNWKTEKKKTVLNQ